MGSQDVATSGNETDAQQPQTLYVAIQPGANMESGQGDQPAVYLEVVEAGSGTEVTSSNGQVNLVQEEMVIDNGNVRAFQCTVCMYLLQNAYSVRLRLCFCKTWKFFTLCNFRNAIKTS